VNQPQTDPVIELHHVTKTFDVWEDRPTSVKNVLVDALRGKFNRGRIHHRTVLADISLKIFPGEFVGIMGRNGAGKSTLMKLIAGIYAPNSGQVMVRGRVAPLLELGAGFAEDLSGLDNIYLNSSILGYSKQAIRTNLQNIIEFSELGDAIHMPVKKYSSGMLVRLGFSIAAHLDAPILLFDEVLAVGDEGFQRKCIQKIKALNDSGKAIILISHSPQQVREYCNRCILMDHHHLAFDGNPDVGTQDYSKLFN